MASLNYDVCHDCRKRVPAEHVIRDGEVYVRKSCPDCGPTEALVSSDAARFFGVRTPRFGGAHPNCGSAALLVSDGQRYRPLSHYGLSLRAVNFCRILKGNRFLSALKILCGPLSGEKLKKQLRKHCNTQSVMLMAVLPFEKYHSVESARLQKCWTGFVYEDPVTDEVRTIPVCMWGMYKSDLQRGIADKYNHAQALAAKPA